MPNPTMIELTDGAAEALGGTRDGATQARYVDRGSTSYADINRMIARIIDHLAHAAAGRVVDEGGLYVGAFPLEYAIAGTAYQFLGETGFLLTDDATNYVWLDDDEELEASTSAFPGTPHHPLAIVTTAGGDILSVRDVRHRNYGRGSGEAWSSYAAGGNVDVDGNDLVDVAEITLTNHGPPAANGLARDAALLKFHDGTAVRVLLTDAAAVTVAQGGTGAASNTDRAVLVGRGTAAIEAVGPGADGVPLIGKGGVASPAFEALSLAGAGVADVLTTDHGGTGSAEEYSLPWGVTVVVPGTLTVAVAPLAIFVPENVVVTRVAASVVTAPTGQAIIVDVRDDSVSLFSGVQANMAQIAATENSGFSAAIEETVVSGSWLTVEIEQIGSGTAGADLTVTIVGAARHL